MNITNEDVSSYIEELYEPLDHQLDCIRAYGIEHDIPIILPEAETLILNLLRIKQPRTILEIGTAIGYSAACFARVCPECRIITIESSQKMYDIATENIGNLQMDNSVEILFGQAQDLIKSVKEPLDFVFIDAAKSHYRTFWDGAIGHCRAGSVIVCDNILMKGITVSDRYLTTRRNKTSMRRMREFLSYISRLDNVDTSIISVGDGLSISVLKG